MTKTFSVPLTAFIVLILMALLFGCAEWNQARVKQKYGEPAKKEIIDDRIMYYYYFSERSLKSPYNVEKWCLDFTFDKNGKLINKREYLVQPELQNKQFDPRQIDPWLNAISGGEPPKIDVTGRWHDTQGSGLFTWGEGYLRQKQEKVSGAIGGYDIKGVVSGKIVYLVFLSKGSVYCTARLEMSQDLLTGNYFKANDREQTMGYPMSLTKTVEPTK
jgi:hypothetical protein